MVATAQCRFFTGQRGDPRFEPADPAPADRHRIILSGIHLDHFTVAGALVADHPLDIDDVAAMDAHEAVLVEALLDVADGDDVVDGDEMGAAIALDRKMAGEAPRRAGAAERSVGAAAEFGAGVVAIAAG